MLGWSQADLAARTRISAVTIRTFERGHNSVKDSTARILRFVFEEGGIVFIDAGEGLGPGLRLARPVP
ncbi:helix-turn-helix domain-containing protein [Pelagibius sp.]|uniref:helix-turn-helix domain-containing protein n=1 Tax=Pelagibius sp. TaxID=1931238 RepID=UPI003B50F6D7